MLKRGRPMAQISQNTRTYKHQMTSGNKMIRVWQWGRSYPAGEKVKGDFREQKTMEPKG